MVSELPETTYAVLGLVDKLPGSSGCELVAVADRSFAHFWPISQTLLYTARHRTQDRLVCGRSTPLAQAPTPTPHLTARPAHPRAPSKRSQAGVGWRSFGSGPGGLLRALTD